MFEQAVAALPSSFSRYENATANTTFYQVIDTAQFVTPKQLVEACLLSEHLGAASSAEQPRVARASWAALDEPNRKLAAVTYLGARACLNVVVVAVGVGDVILTPSRSLF